MSADEIYQRVSVQFAGILDRFVASGGFPLTMTEGVIHSSFGTEEDEQAWRLSLMGLESDLLSLLLQENEEDSKAVKVLLSDVAIFYRTVAHFQRLGLSYNGGKQSLSESLDSLDTTDTPWITHMNGLRAAILRECLSRGWLSGAETIDVPSFCGTLEALSTSIEGTIESWQIPIRRFLKTWWNSLKLKRRHDSPDHN